jgi:hypothetical protein
MNDLLLRACDLYLKHPAGRASANIWSAIWAA